MGGVCHARQNHRRTGGFVDRGSSGRRSVDRKVSVKVENAEMVISEVWRKPKKDDWQIQLGSRVSVGQLANGTWYVAIANMRKNRHYSWASAKTIFKFKDSEEVDAFFDAMITIKEGMASNQSLHERMKAREVPTPQD